MFCPACQVEVMPEQRRCGACEAALPLDWGFWVAAGGPLTGLVVEERYRAERFVARGGMGSVYRGTDLTLGRPVAIKFLDPKYRSDEEVVSRFQHESRAAASLEHPNIVPIFSVGEHREHYYFVMKFIEGCTVGDLVRREGRLGLAEALKITLQIARGLEHIHERGYVHRDVKPNNVMVEEHGHAWILDFGILRHRESTLTQTGLVAGTPAYMAPEQARDVRAASPHSDLYSLGVMLFEMIVGHGPFVAETPIDVLAKHLTEAAPRLSLFLPEIPVRVEELVTRALRKEPGERHGSAKEMGEAAEAALREIATGDRHTARPPGDPATGRPLEDRTLELGLTGATDASIPSRALDGMTSRHDDTRAFVAGATGPSETLVMGSAGSPALDESEQRAPPAASLAEPIGAIVSTRNPAEAASPPKRRRLPVVPLLLLALGGTVVALVLTLDPSGQQKGTTRGPRPRSDGLAGAARSGLPHSEAVSGTQATISAGSGPPDGGTVATNGRGVAPAKRVTGGSLKQRTVAKRGKLVIRSTPRGALVFLGRRKLGKTPVTRRVSAGRYWLVVSRPGFFTERRWTRVRSGTTRIVSVALRKRPTRLEIRVLERGRLVKAQVLLDGRSLGTLSRADLQVKPGRHRVMILRPGYVTQQKLVHVEPGESQRASFELTRR